MPHAFFFDLQVKFILFARFYNDRHPVNNVQPVAVQTDQFGRIVGQKPDAFYEEHADFIFVNDGSVADADRFVEKLVSDL